ncbi:hypothetical protein L1887_12350 [Cichorium endivia]|nr:hypothetical protein L1887_12350 [Cichorium endivia]
MLQGTGETPLPSTTDRTVAHHHLLSSSFSDSKDRVQAKPAVETLSNPSLKGKPMAVGSMSMISTANYEARKFGVRAAMPGFIACKLCPDLIFVPTDFKKYTYYSDLTRKAYGLAYPHLRNQKYLRYKMRASVEIRLESQFSVLLDTTGLLPPSSTVHSGFQPPSPLLGFTDGTHSSSATYHGAHQTSCSVQFATLADSCYPISFSHFASHPNLRKQEENPRMDLRIWFSFVSYVSLIHVSLT